MSKDLPLVEREQLIESHLPLVRAIARRYVGRGETLDDLIQVGALGLIRATDRFDPVRGVAFATFATPAIDGEIRRHLSDRTSSIRIPREMQQLSGQLRRSRTHLAGSLGREPTVDELATALGVTHADVERGLAAERAREANSESPSVDELIGHDESGSAADDRLLLGLAARVLNERERRIVFLRFYADMTEREIASDLRISQGQVSRLLGAALGKLREELDRDISAPDGPDISHRGAISRGRAGTDLQLHGQTPQKRTSKPAAEPRIADVGASQQKAGRASADSTHQLTASAGSHPRDLELPYHVIVTAQGDDGWTAAIEELPGCSAQGTTPEEAVEQLRSTMETWLHAAVDDRRVIAPPKRQSSKRKAATNPSGRFLVRMPSDLHQELTRAAEREQVSLNRYVTDTLAASLAGSGEKPAGQHSSGEAEGAPARQTRSFRMLLAANIVVVVVAAAAAVALLILALERGI